MYVIVPDNLICSLAAWMKNCGASQSTPAHQLYHSQRRSLSLSLCAGDAFKLWTRQLIASEKASFGSRRVCVWVYVSAYEWMRSLTSKWIAYFDIY